MNVYIYEGLSRLNATPILISNKPPTLNTVYKVNVTSGIVVVAFPNKDEDTEL